MKPAVLFKVLFLLCTSFPEGGFCYCPTCEENTDTDTCTFQVHDIPSCSDSDCLKCKYGRSNSDDFQPNASSFQVTVKYISRKDARVLVTWALPDGDPPSSTRSLTISYHFHDSGRTDIVCLSLASKITRVDAPLKFPPEYCNYKDFIDKISVTLTTHGARCGQIQRTLRVHNCYETMGKQSEDMCGIKIPAAPESAKALVIPQPPSQSAVQFSWKPPKNGTNVDKYIITLKLKGKLHETKPLVPGNATEYTVTLNETLSASDKVDATVQAGIKMYPFLCKCCLHKTESSVWYGFGPPANATLHFPDRPSSNYVNLIVWPLTGGGVVIVLVVLCILHCISKIRKKPGISGPKYEPVPTSDGAEMDIHEQGTVYLVASTEEDDGMRQKIRHLYNILTDHELEPVYYEYALNNQEDGPSALGMNQWVELQFSRCQFVLFVCTKKFLEEWNGERRDILSPLVYPCRNLLEGSLTRPQNISRFAIIFMGDGHSVPPILGRFRQFDVFRAGSEVIHANDLIHYLLEVPPFVPPRVVNFARQLV